MVFTPDPQIIFAKVLRVVASTLLSFLAAMAVVAGITREAGAEEPQPERVRMMIKNGTEQSSTEGDNAVPPAFRQRRSNLIDNVHLPRNASVPSKVNLPVRQMGSNQSKIGYPADPQAGQSIGPSPVCPKARCPWWDIMVPVPAHQEKKSSEPIPYQRIIGSFNSTVNQIAPKSTQAFWADGMEPRGKRTRLIFDYFGDGRIENIQIVKSLTTASPEGQAFALGLIQRIAKGPLPKVDCGRIRFGCVIESDFPADLLKPIDK